MDTVFIPVSPGLFGPLPTSETITVPAPPGETMDTTFAPVVPGLIGPLPRGPRFVLPTLTTPSLGTTKILKPTWTALASGKDPYRPWVRTILDGTAYFANGWDQAWYADIDGAAFWPLGSTAPASFAVADAAGGTTFPIGMVLFYYLVFRNSSRGEETAPQPTTDAGGTPVAGVSHTMVANKSATITWTAGEATARFDKVRIYRRRQNSDSFVKVAEVATSAGTYTDATPDATLSTALADNYVPRYRLTLPPVFKGHAAHLGRLFAFTGLDSNLYYGQQVRPDGELVETDIPAGQILPIEPNDGLGEITAVVAHYDILLVFKRRGCYAVEGDSPANFTVRRMFADRGCLGARCVVSVLATLVFLDEQGLFVWDVAGEPQVVGAQSGLAPSPLAPIWKRLNLDAADFFHLTHNEELGYVEARVALDFSPVPNRRYRLNYRNNRYESEDDGLVSFAAGVLQDAAGNEYRCRLDELGDLFQEDVGESEGVFDGAPAVGVLRKSFDHFILSTALSTDSLLGPLGTPLDLIDADGNVVDENRVAAQDASTSITPLYWSDVAIVAGDSTYQNNYLSVGKIGHFWETAVFDFQTSDWKVVRCWIVEADVETLGLLRIDTFHDESPYVFRRTLDLTDEAGWWMVPCNERGFRQAFRASSRYAGHPCSVRALRADWWAHRKRV